jgi:hypothetical protein
VYIVGAGGVVFHVRMSLSVAFVESLVTGERLE